MALKGLFYNAFPDDEFETGYDRNYSADDISDWFSIVCDTGILKGGWQVVANTGLSVKVSIGKATIKGKGAINTSLYELDLETAPTGANSRYDLIVLRMNNVQTKSARNPELLVITGTSSIPTVEDLERTSDVYDLLLAYVNVRPNATSIQQTDIIDVRGDQTLCPYFTAVKGYDDYYDAIIQQFEYNTTLGATSTTVVTNLASSLYNDKYSLVEVYTNGLKEENTDYSVSASSEFITITFTQTKNAGAEISVILDNFIDGEGLNNALENYNEWVNDVETLKEAYSYTYLCNGVDDNIKITNLVNTFLNGGTDYNSLNLKIIGNFGFNSYASGDGTSASPYRLFNFVGGNRRVNLDFSNCSQITINLSNKYLIVFKGSNLIINGLNIVANGTTAGTSIKIFNTSLVVCENCRFWINGYTESFISSGGTFTNCRGSVSTATGNCYCFLTADLLRVNGGEYLAYTGQSSARSAIVGQSASNAVSILYGVSAPTVARAGYYQINALYQVNSNNYINCTDLISALPLYVTTGYSNIRGTIPYSKN